MHIIPLSTRMLRPRDDLAALLAEAMRMEEGDIVVVSSKAVATVEGAAIDLRNITPSAKAKTLAKETGHRTPAFIQAVLDETERLHGRVVGSCPGALLTEVQPDGLPRGTILTANAGLDESNIEQGFAIGWPRDPVQSVRRLKHSLEKLLHSGALSSIPPPLPPGEEGVRRRKKPLLSTIKHFCREMRKKPTPAEQKLWEAVRYDQLGVRFRRQYPYGGCILDFYVPSHRLVIEVDGGYHSEKKQQQQDRIREIFLTADCGLRTIHIRNEDVLKHLDSVLELIRQALMLPPPPPEEGPGVEETKQKHTLAVLLTDSCCRPRRWGVTAFALAACGIDPLRSEAGKEDLFGKKLHITTEAVADQLATAANFVMGNAAQSTPAAIIRNHGLSLSDFCGWVMGITPEEDLFRGLI